MRDPDNNQKLNGMIRHSRSRITIDGELSRQVKQQVLWHEVLHAILMQTGFDDQDERMLDCLSHGIMGVLLHNREMRDWLIEEQGG